MTVASRAPIEPVSMRPCSAVQPICGAMLCAQLRSMSMTVCLCPKRASICQRAIIMMCPLLVPGLNNGLARDFAALEFAQGHAQHLQPIGVGAGLTECDLAIVGDAGVDVMRHRAAADV